MSESTKTGTPLWSDQDRTGWYQNAFDWFVKGAQTVDSSISSSTTKDKHGFTDHVVTTGDTSYKLRITRDFHDRFQMCDPTTGDIRYKCEVPQTQEEALSSGAAFAKFASTESLDAKHKAARKMIEDRVLRVMDKLDPAGDNTRRWKDIFKGMDDTKFAKFIQDLVNHRDQITVIMPNMKKNLKISDCLAAAKEVGLKTSHRLWLPDRTRPGKKYLTNEKYLVLELPIRRAQQEIDKKLSVPSRDKHVDALTGQVIQDDKAGALSAPEIQALTVRGLESVLNELVRVRGGDVNAYGDFRRQLQENGEATLKSLDPRTRARSAVIAHVLLEGMMIENNL